MSMFISGGCKNGKSMYAQKVAKELSENLGKKMYYVATMIPEDDEDYKRIERHIREREGFGFETIEESENLCRIFSKKEFEDIDMQSIFLVDSVTAILQNNMFDKTGKKTGKTSEDVISDLLKFQQKAPNTIFVSDYIYSDAEKYIDSVEDYRKNLGKVDQSLARTCDKVVEVTHGLSIEYK